MRYTAILLATLLYSGAALADAPTVVINTQTGKVTTVVKTGQHVTTHSNVTPRDRKPVPSFSQTPEAQAADAHIIEPFVVPQDND